MIRNVKYGPYDFPPWTEENGYIDSLDKNSKFFRTKEPRSLWQGVTAETTDITLNVCPKCFLYTALEDDIAKHKCRILRPPGVLLYDSPDYAIHEVTVVDQSTQLFAQCLCLFGRLFLDTKSIYYALEHFTFYTLYDKETGYCAGFFSKEKSSWFDYNLACIIVFPCFQKRNLGALLIAFSYHLSRQDSTVGSPEKPLSKHGQRAYLSYWCNELCQIFLSNTKIGSLRTIGKQTGIDPEDLVVALEHMDAISKRDGKPSIDVNKIKEYYLAHPPKKIFDEKYVVKRPLIRPQIPKPAQVPPVPPVPSVPKSAVVKPAPAAKPIEAKPEPSQETTQQASQQVKPTEATVASPGSAPAAPAATPSTPAEPTKSTAQHQSQGHRNQ